jgi:hypothetical protein
MILFDHEMISVVTAYFDRYSKMKIFQLQGADDEFFLPDSEVRLSIIHQFDEH